MHAPAHGFMFAMAACCAGNAVLRAPARVVVPDTHTAPAMRPYTALALLFCLGSPLAAQQATGLIEGQVTDSVHAGPLAGATVSATPMDARRDTAFVATTDNGGRFRFESLDAGPYALSFASPMLDSLQFGGRAPVVYVSPGNPTRVELAVPSRATLRGLACPGVAFTDSTGALLGLVVDAASGKPLAGAQVAVAWSDLRADSAKGVVSNDRAAKVTVDAAGQYRVCGLPTNDPLLVQVQHGQSAGAVLRMRIPHAVGVLVRDVSFSSAGAMRFTSADADTAALPTGTARLAGIVRDNGGRPLSGAQVRVLGTAGSGRTDERGAYELSGLPAGTQEVEVRQFGYGIVRGPVELRDDQRTRLDAQLEKITTLGAVTTVAARVKYPEFEQRRREAIGGRFLDEATIKTMNFHSTADYVNLLPGYRTLLGRHGNMRIVSIRDQDCEPAVLVNDLPIVSLTDLPPPIMLGAVEVYPSTVGAPPNHRSPCGTIVFWSRR